MPSLATEGKIKETGFAKVHAGESVGVFNEKLIVDAIEKQDKRNVENIDKLAGAFANKMDSILTRLA